MIPLREISLELRDLGYQSEIVANSEFEGCSAVLFDYPVTTGRHRNHTFRLGIGFQEEGYPEYPPHFVYVADLPNPQLPIYASFRYDDAEWSAFSVPPSDFWDGLPFQDKNMKTYIYRHLARFWSQV